MSVLINGQPNVLFQGLTGQIAVKHAINMKNNNTKIIAGVAPQKGGTFVNEWPIYDTVRQALDEHAIDLSIIYAPPKHAANAIIESIESEIKLIVCVTEGIPVHEMLRVYNRLAQSNSILIGPCSPGIYIPGEAKIGFIPDAVGHPGNVGVVGKSGTLTYEICYQMKRKGIGQSTIIGIGGDSIKGFSFLEALKLFEQDEKTTSIVLIGEIGGNEEEEAAKYIKKNISKPVISFIAGKSAPEDIPMGHAGALISNSEGNYKDKVAALTENGVHVADSIFDVTDLIEQLT